MKTGKFFSIVLALTFVIFLGTIKTSFGQCYSSVPSDKYLGTIYDTCIESPTGGGCSPASMMMLGYTALSVSYPCRITGTSFSPGAGLIIAILDEFNEYSDAVWIFFNHPYTRPLPMPVYYYPAMEWMPDPYYYYPLSDDSELAFYIHNDLTSQDYEEYQTVHLNVNFNLY